MVKDRLCFREPSFCFIYSLDKVQSSVPSFIKPLCCICFSEALVVVLLLVVALESSTVAVLAFKW